MAITRSDFDNTFASNGSAENWSDENYKVGWSSIGGEPPTITQFNRLQQISDEKAKFLLTVVDSKAPKDAATTSSAGIVQLSSSTDSDSETTAATPKAVKTGLATKVDKVDGKGLSTNDYTVADMTVVSSASDMLNLYTNAGNKWPISVGGTGSNTADGARTNLGLGSAATCNTGNSGATVPLCSQSNNWSGTNTFAGLIASNALFNGGFQVNSNILATGYRCRNGISGSWVENSFNIYWAGNAAYMYIDNTQVWKFGSDKLLKKDIEYISTYDALAQVNDWKPALFKYKARGVIEESAQKLGFIANDLITVSPKCVFGDGLTESDNIANPENQPYQLDLAAMIATQALAIQELTKKVEQLEKIAE